MLFPRLISVRPLCLGSALLLGIVPTALSAQDAPPQSAPPAAPQPAQPQPIHLKDYSIPRSAFPHVLQPYMHQELAQPNLGNSPRIDSLMRDGKIYLSIDDAIALALENNLDLDIARYNLNIAEADLLRAKSGASILGVNTGIVQNTPGGGVGGLGGTVGSGSGGTHDARRFSRKAATPSRPSGEARILAMRSAVSWMSSLVTGRPETARIRSFASRCAAGLHASIASTMSPSFSSSSASFAASSCTSPSRHASAASKRSPVRK